MKINFDRFEIDDDPNRIDRDAVWQFLTGEAYWGRWRTRLEVETQISRAWRVVGAYEAGGGRLVGFARAVSDGFGVAYLADVFVVEASRGIGLGAAVVTFMIEGGDGSKFRWMLHASEAAPFYRGLGFGSPDERYMERPPRPSGSHGTDETGSSFHA